MDNFEALLNSASLIAEEENTSFEDALASVLSEAAGAMPADYTENPQPEGGIPKPASTLTVDHIGQLVTRLIPNDIEGILQISDWTESGDEDYPFACRFNDSTFSEQKRTDVCILPQSADAALAAGLYPISDTGNGYVELRAQSVPAADLEAVFRVIHVL